MATSNPSPFARRLSMVAGTAVVAALVLWFLHLAGIVIILGFAGVLLAVFLDGVARPLRRHTPIPRAAALLVVVAALSLLLVAIGWLFGPKIVEQVTQLLEQLPEAVREIRRQLASHGWGKALLEQIRQVGGLGQLDGQVLQSASGMFGTFTKGVVYAAVIVFLGVYFAARPELYKKVVIALVPPVKRDRVRGLLELEGYVLRRWLVGRFASMAVVGVLTATGLFIIGLPLAFALGLLAGLLSFIPYLGPFLSAVPAVLVGLLQGPVQALWVAGLYVGIQFVESYLVTPLIQQRAVSIPPAFQILAQLAAGIVIGALGVLLATPLTVVATVAVQLLYIEDVLGERVDPLGTR